MDANEGLGLVDFAEQNMPAEELETFRRGVAARVIELGFAESLPEQAAVTAAPEAPVSVETLLSPEQLGYADKVANAMTEKFGIDRENIRFVAVDSPEHGKQVVAVDASPNGLRKGSWNKVTKERQKEAGEFMLDVDGDGAQVDALSGTTDAAYRAMIADAKARGVNPLPDSYALSQQKENGEPWTWTMLTGEPLTADGGVQIRGVPGGGVYGYLFRPDSGNRALRVRPAVVVAQLES